MHANHEDHEQLKFVAVDPFTLGLPQETAGKR
jgi:hypothetical protein